MADDRKIPGPPKRSPVGPAVVTLLLLALIIGLFLAVTSLSGTEGEAPQRETDVGSRSLSLRVLP